MRVSFNLPGPLRNFTGGRSTVPIAVSSPTVRDALEALWGDCPALKDRILNEQGQVREHLHVFIGNENIRFTGGLDTSIESDCEITVIHAVSGG
jgi:molybdopterin converting factor small subunit